MHALVRVYCYFPNKHGRVRGMATTNPHGPAMAYATPDQNTKANMPISRPLKVRAGG